MSEATSAGLRTFELSDPRTQAVIPVRVLYPSRSPAGVATLGPYQLDASVDGSIETGTFPLVVFSHGTGGSGMVHRTTAQYLARHGFVVALPEHPGNNRDDNRLANTIANLENRPRHVRAIIDWAFDASPFADRLKSRTVAIVGHSMGGYTALVLAGGVPTSFSREPSAAPGPRIDVTADERVKALVLLAPATGWFSGVDALRRVHIPILMLTAEHDEHTAPWQAGIVTRGVCGDLVEHRTIANAGHFSFQSSFPPAMHKPGFLPAHDPPGFDRACFNREMNADIRAFLERVL